MKFKTILGASLLLATVSAVHAQQASGAKELFYGTDGQSTVVEANAASKPTATAAALPTAALATAVKAKPSVASPTPSPTRVATVNPARVATARPDRLGLKTSVKLVAADGSTRTVSPSTKFKSGDVIQLALQSNKTGYLYVVNIGSTGKETVLFPSKAAENNRVVAFQEYIIPARMKFDANAGVEQLIVALSPTPTNSVETRVQGMKLVTISTQPGSRTDAAGANRVAAMTPESSVATAPAPLAEARAERGSNALATLSSSIVLADASGSRDLILDDSETVLTAVSSMEVSKTSQLALAPLVLNIKLVHE